MLFCDSIFKENTSKSKYMYCIFPEELTLYFYLPTEELNISFLIEHSKNQNTRRKGKADVVYLYMM